MPIPAPPKGRPRRSLPQVDYSGMDAPTIDCIVEPIKEEEVEELSTRRTRSSSATVGASASTPASGSSATTNNNRKPGVFVLARFPGGIQCPGRIIAYEDLPLYVRDLKSQSGIYQCIQFPIDDSYAWIPTADITPLTRLQIDTYIQNAESLQDQGLLDDDDEKLLRAYKIARNPHQWSLLSKPTSQPRPKPKPIFKQSHTHASPTMSTTKSIPSSQKRPANVSSPYQVSDESDFEPPTRPSPKRQKVQGSQSNSQDNYGTEIYEIRRKLQRILLSGIPPSPEDMSTCSELFTTIEHTSTDKLTYSILHESKLKATMGYIAKLTAAFDPAEPKYDFSSRATALVAVWNRRKGESRLSQSLTPSLSMSDSSGPSENTLGSIAAKNSLPSPPSTQASPRVGIVNVGTPPTLTSTPGASQTNAIKQAALDKILNTGLGKNPASDAQTTQTPPTPLTPAAKAGQAIIQPPVTPVNNNNNRLVELERALAEIQDEHKRLRKEHDAAQTREQHHLQELTALHQQIDERDKGKAPVSEPVTTPSEREEKLIKKVEHLTTLLNDEIKNSTLRKKMDKLEEERRANAAVRTAYLDKLREIEAAEEKRKKEAAELVFPGLLGED